MPVLDNADRGCLSKMGRAHRDSSMQLAGRALQAESARCGHAGAENGQDLSALLLLHPNKVGILSETLQRDEMMASSHEVPGAGFD